MIRRSPSLLASIGLLAVLLAVLASCGPSSPQASSPAGSTATPAPTETPSPTPVPTQPPTTSGEVLETAVITGGAAAYQPPPDGFVFVAFRLHIDTGKDLSRDALVFTLEAPHAGYDVAPEPVKTPELAPLPDGFEQEGWVTFVVDKAATAADLHIVFGPSEAESVTIPVTWSATP